MSDGIETEIKITQIMGPKVPGLEHDPPAYHFDITDEEFGQLIADPVLFLKSLGLGPEQGVGMDGIVNVQLPNPSLGWTDDEGWVDSTAKPKKPKKCALLLAQTVMVHVHC